MVNMHEHEQTHLRRPFLHSSVCCEGVRNSCSSPQQFIYLYMCIRIFLFNFNEGTCPNPLGRHHRQGFKNCACAVSDGPNKMSSVKIKNQRVFTLYNVLPVYIVVGG